MRNANATWFLGAVLACTLSAALLAAAPAPDSAQGFVTKAALAGLAEVELAKHAGANSRSDAVKNFSVRMVTDHQKVNEELASIARPKGLTVPMQLDAEHTKAVQELRGKSPGELDAAYARHMVMDHDKAVALFEANSASMDAEIAAFARKTLPTLQEHKRLAHELDARVNKK